jgi:hypothetical protein
MAVRIDFQIFSRASPSRSNSKDWERLSLTVFPTPCGLPPHNGYSGSDPEIVHS